jgi:uncharacterized protein (TIGR03089 family)
MTDAPTSGTPVELLQLLLATEPGRPLLTYYDDAAGARVELSVATFDNWVAKTANLLVDGLGGGPGTRVSLLVPAHWQAVVWLLACWSTGATVAPGGDPVLADVAVAGPEEVGRAAAAAAETVVLSLSPLGAPCRQPLPAGVVDYAVEVPAYGDRFTPPVPPGPGDPALLLPDGTRVDQGALVRAAGALAVRDGLRAGDRVLTDRGLGSVEDIGYLLLAPLLVDGSVVLCPRLDLLDVSAVSRRVEEERVTVVADRCGTRRVG